MSDVFNRLMGLDPSVLERERFSLTPEAARLLLRKDGKARKRRQPKEQKYLYQPPKVMVRKKKRKPKATVERRRVVINLTPAQQRAFDNWMGKGK